MNKIFSILITAVIALSASAKVTYVVWQSTPATGNREWIKADYYIWENTYTQTNVDDALEFTATGKGWIGGGYESIAPFDNSVLTDGYELVFDINTTDRQELSVQLTAVNPEAAQTVKLSFDRDGEWHTIRLNPKKNFSKVFKAWEKGTTGYVFSLIGGTGAGEKIYIRNIRYEKKY